MERNKEKKKTIFKRKANEIIVYDLYFNIVNRIQVSYKGGKPKIDIIDENKIILIMPPCMRKKRLIIITNI